MTDAEYYYIWMKFNVVKIEFKRNVSVNSNEKYY